MILARLRIQSERDVMRLRTLGARIVAATGFAGFAGTRVVTAMLELARNMIDHAPGGHLSLILREEGAKIHLVIEAVDQGLGIEASRKAAQGPGARRAGLGLGLQGVQRMADQFDLQTGIEGTRVIASFVSAIGAAEMQRDRERILALARSTEEDDLSAVLERQNRDLLDAIEERDLLMAEVHHRTKNNLSLVISLMRLSRNAAKSDEAREILRDLEGRVSAIAKVHDQLQHEGAADTVELVSLLHDVASQSRNAFASTGRDIEISVEGQPARLPSSTAVDLSLVVGELITNACKHAFPDCEQGKITIRAEDSGRDFILVIRDDGIGLPEELVRPGRAMSLGWRMVRSMVQKHGGTLQNHNDGGLVTTLTFDRALIGIETAHDDAPAAARD